MRRNFPRWMNEPPMCRYGHGPMKEQHSELPKFVAATGSIANGRHIARTIWVCKRRGCPWVSIGECECIVSRAFRNKEMKLTYMVGE